jgi:hypothetical protein
MGDRGGDIHTFGGLHLGHDDELTSLEFLLKRHKRSLPMKAGK